MAPDLTNALLNDISQLYNNADDYDVNITVGEGFNSETFRAHSIILRARSSYFRAALYKDWIRKQDNIIVFNKPNISPKVFKILLKYFYTGTYSIDESNQELILELLIAADELALTDLVEHIQENITVNKSNWINQNLLQVYKTSTTYESFNIFRFYCERLICEQPNLFFESQEYISMDSSIITLIIQKDELALDEIDIWNNIIKWGISQVPQINLSELNQENLIELKNRVKGLVQYIRFLDISEDDFFKKVWPLIGILSKDLMDQLLNIHVNHALQVKDRNPLSNSLTKRSSQRFTSYIINFQRANLLANWIDCKDYGISNEFKLLLRGSRDGKDLLRFHSMCDNKGPTLILIKLQGSNKIIGGYNPFSWGSSNRWLPTQVSFIFCFDDSKNSHVLSRVYNESRAIKDMSPNYSGIGFGNNDLAIFDGICTKHHYEKKILNTESFIMEDYEVFKVIKKNN